MPHDVWIANLADKVVLILEEKYGKKAKEALESRLCYNSAFSAAAREQGTDLSDHGTYRYAHGAVKKAAKRLFRRERPQPAEPITRPSPAKRWIEHSLPPGDRD